MEYYYEVLWYIKENENDEEMYENYDYLEFDNYREAMQFYHRHKYDLDKYGWWITKRDEEGFVIKDYIY